MKTYNTKEMVYDLKNFDFYIKDDIGVSLMRNNIINIFKSSYENFYRVEVNYALYERYRKIYQITKSDKLRKIFELISFCEKNKVESHDIMEIELSRELSKTINKEIIEQLQKLR